MENFITGIQINESRNIRDFRIDLSSEERRHLILTGKNGSGKTSLLEAMDKFIQGISGGGFKDIDSNRRSIENYKELLDNETLKENWESYNSSLKLLQDILKETLKVELFFLRSLSRTQELFKNKKFIVAFFDSKRHSSITVPRGINKFEFKNFFTTKERVNNFFIQYIVNLKAERSFARDDNDMKAVQEIDAWFERFTNRLNEIFGTDNLELKFNRENYNFDILIDGLEPFTLNTLSDGYSAIISIVSELLLRMEAYNVKGYDLQGVVIIDEIETHLHVDLQKKILPFLIDFFPKLQFIVTTHSPFVLSSVSNATICDLETRTVTNDLSSYSYDALIESYFRTDKYSDVIKLKITEFEELIDKDNKTNEEISRLRYLRNYFNHAPKYLSDELLVKLQQISLKEIIRNKKK